MIICTCDSVLNQYQVIKRTYAYLLLWTRKALNSYALDYTPIFRMTLDERLCKNQVILSSVINFAILMSTVFREVVTLSGDVAFWSLLRLKRLHIKAQICKDSSRSCLWPKFHSDIRLTPDRQKDLVLWCSELSIVFRLLFMQGRFVKWVNTYRLVCLSRPEWSVSTCFTRDLAGHFLCYIADTLGWPAYCVVADYYWTTLHTVLL